MEVQIQVTRFGDTNMREDAMMVDIVAPLSCPIVVFDSVNSRQARGGLIVGHSSPIPDACIIEMSKKADSLGGDAAGTKASC